MGHHGLIPTSTQRLVDWRAMTHTEARDQRPWWRSPRATSLITISLAIVAVAEADIHKRESSEIRGSKLLWRLVSLNALGALAYFRWGRVRSA